MSASEAAMIDRLRELFPRFGAEVGIGDDAAVLPAGGRTVVTTDMLIEDVDFTSAIPMRFVARKSLAANLSDLAAMGARPAWFTMSLAFPSRFLPSFDEFAESLACASREWRIELIGGDLSRSREIAISITACGSLPDGARPLLRSGAKPGDRIYVSRPLGASAAGLALLGKGWTIAGDGSVAPPASDAARLGYSLRELAASLIGRHVDPSPEIELGLKLSALPQITSCIDISDGFSTDLHHLCAASACGAEVERTRIPVFQDLTASAPALGLDVRQAVLHGGEEYALLFTSSLRESELSARTGRPVYAVGRITRGREVVLVTDGVATPLEPGGFDHFA
jgi:thiamine-monophosphate kinase